MRKNIIGLLFLLVLCLVTHSCKRFSLYSEKDNSIYHSVIQSISDTMMCCPDVALEMLISASDTVDDQSLSKPNYYQYQILIAEALYKNNFLQTNYSDVVEATRFFDSLAEKHSNNVDVLFLKSRAHYYKAVGETEKENVKNACNDYLISLTTIDEIKNKDRNYEIEYFNGLIYNRLARIYFDFTNDIALKIYDKANESFIKCQANFSLALNCNSIAKILSSENRYDESEKYLAMADSLINNNVTNDNLAAKKLRESIAMTRAINMSDSQKRYYEALCIMKEIYKNSNDENDRIIRSATLAEMYYQNNMVDSALYYYEMAFENNHPAKMTIASRIVDICKTTNNTRVMAHYAPFLAEETHKELEFTPLKAELIAMYEQYEADRHKEEIINLWLKIIGALVALMIVLVAVFYVVSIVRKRRHLIEINRKDWYIGTLHGKIKKTNEENKIAKENIKSFEEKLDLLNEVKKHEPVSYAESMQNIKNYELCKKLMAVMQMNIKTTLQYPELALTEDEKLQIVEIFDKELDGAIRAIINKYPRLKKSDEIVLCLSLLGFDNKHIAAVIGSSYHNVFVRSQKCLEILGGGEDLQDMLVAMVSSANPPRFVPSRD